MPLPLLLLTLLLGLLLLLLPLLPLAQTQPLLLPLLLPLEEEDKLEEREDNVEEDDCLRV